MTDISKLNDESLLKAHDYHVEQSRHHFGMSEHFDRLRRQSEREILRRLSLVHRCPSCQNGEQVA